MKSEQTVAELGPYSTECCSAELVFYPGDTFTLEDLDRPNGMAV